MHLPQISVFQCFIVTSGSESASSKQTGLYLEAGTQTDGRQTGVKSIALDP